ncbi:MAG: hypothetical protein AAFN10_28495 [Bacteroidota bacterium]
MQDFPSTNTQSFQMFQAINQGMYDIYLPQVVEREIAAKMMDTLLEHGENFSRCSNEMRNMFFQCCQSMIGDIDRNMATIPQGYRLSILWKKVCRLIYEGMVPYVALKQVCQQIQRILLSIESDHSMLISQGSMLSLILIWIDFHGTESMLSSNC